MHPLANVEGQDIHGIPATQWGELDADLVGTVVEVRIVCAHAFGVGVELTAHRASGHVDIPSIKDGYVTLEIISEYVGELRKALLLAADPGRQPKLTLRPSVIQERTGAK
jgi:predicted RNA-binding protein with RPS1 domain